MSAYEENCLAMADKASAMREWDKFEYWWDMFFIHKTIVFLSQDNWQYATMFATSVSGRHGEGKRIKDWCWAQTIAFVHTERPELKEAYERETQAMVAWAKEKVMSEMAKMIKCSDGKLACKACLEAYNSTIMCGLEHGNVCSEPRCRFFKKPEVTPTPLPCRCGATPEKVIKQGGGREVWEGFFCRKCKTVKYGDGWPGAARAWNEAQTCEDAHACEMNASMDGVCAVCGREPTK